MITIARNLCFRYLRSIGKKEIPLEGITEHLCSDCTEEQKEVDLQILFDAIEKLPEKSKEVFKLSVLDGYSHIEIGQMLHIVRLHNFSERRHNYRRCCTSTGYFCYCLCSCLYACICLGIGKQKILQRTNFKQLKFAREKLSRMLRRIILARTST